MSVKRTISPLVEISLGRLSFCIFYSIMTNTCMCITLHFCLKYDGNFLALMELGLLSTLYINHALCPAILRTIAIML